MTNVESFFFVLNELKRKTKCDLSNMNDEMIVLLGLVK